MRIIKQKYVKPEGQSGGSKSIFREAIESLEIGYAAVIGTEEFEENGMARCCTAGQAKKRLDAMTYAVRQTCLHKDKIFRTVVCEGLGAKVYRVK